VPGSHIQAGLSQGLIIKEIYFIRVYVFH